MKILSKATVVLITLLLAGCGSSPAAAQHEEAAKEAAAQWLALLDAGQYGQSWEEASTLFRASITKEGWEASIRNVYAQLDTLKSRDPIAAKYTTSLPGAQAGEYVVIQYSTVFGTTGTVETVTMMRDGDAWKAAGYFVKPA